MARMRYINPGDLLSEEEVLQNSSAPFLGPGDRPEPYRSQYVAYARLQPVFRKERIAHSPLIVQTPRGLGLVWRWWPRSVGIVLIKPVNGEDDEWEVDDSVTFLEPTEYDAVRLDLTRILLNPPKWH